MMVVDGANKATLKGKQKKNMKRQLPGYFLRLSPDAQKGTMLASADMAGAKKMQGRRIWAG
jgi:hypothetical protein